MSDDLSMLPEEAQVAFHVIEGVRIYVTSRERIKKPEGEDLFDVSLATIRTELLRLARENVEQRNGAMLLARTYAEAEAELAKLKARIAEAPVATLLHGNGELLVAVSAEDPADWAGKVVRLLLENK